MTKTAIGEFIKANGKEIGKAIVMATATVTATTRKHYESTTTSNKSSRKS